MPKKNFARNNGKQFLDTNRRGGEESTKQSKQFQPSPKHPAHADENMGGEGQGNDFITLISSSRSHHAARSHSLICLLQNIPLLSLAVTISDLSQSRLGHTHTHTHKPCLGKSWWCVWEEDMATTTTKTPNVSRTKKKKPGEIFKHLFSLCASPVRNPLLPVVWELTYPPSITP